MGEEGCVTSFFLLPLPPSFTRPPRPTVAKEEEEEGYKPPPPPAQIPHPPSFPLSFFSKPSHPPSFFLSLLFLASSLPPSSPSPVLVLPSSHSGTLLLLFLRPPLSNASRHERQRGKRRRRKRRGRQRNSPSTAREGRKEGEAGDASLVFHTLTHTASILIPSATVPFPGIVGEEGKGGGERGTRTNAAIQNQLHPPLPPKRKGREGKEKGRGLGERHNGFLRHC